MQLRDLDLNLLPVLDSLLRHGSVSRAADHLGLTQSALSHALRRLRDYFQDPLFVRAGGRMLPTRKATELEPVVTAMLENARTHLVAGAGFDPGQTSRRFRVTMSDMAAAYFMPRLVRSLRQLAPFSQLCIVSLPPRDIPAALERGDIDLAMGTTRLAVEGLYQQQVVVQELVCIAAANNPAFEAGMTLEAYLGSTHAGVSPFGLDVDMFDGMMVDHGLRRRFCMMVHSFLALPSLIQDTDVIATVPECLPNMVGSAFAIRAMPLPVSVPAPILRQAWHPRFHSDPGNIWLRQMVFELFAADAPRPLDPLHQHDVISTA